MEISIKIKTNILVYERECLIGSLIETITLKPRLGWLIDFQKKASISENSKIVEFDPF